MQDAGQEISAWAIFQKCSGNVSKEMLPFMLKRKDGNVLLGVADPRIKNFAYRLLVPSSVRGVRNIDFHFRYALAAA